MAIIYKLTNLINGKIYIGYTKSYERRMREHRNSKKSSRHMIAKAIIKHGFNNFLAEKVYENDDATYTRTIMEPYLIKYYRSHCSTRNGYNMSFGGEFENGMKRSIETRMKISASLKGKFCTQETREKRRVNSTGRRASEETKQKMRLKHIARGCNVDVSSKDYLITYQDNRQEKITNINKFARDNGYNHSSLYKLMNSSIKFHKNIIKVERL